MHLSSPFVVFPPLNPGASRVSADTPVPLVPLRAKLRELPLLPKKAAHLFPHNGLAGLTQSTAGFVTGIHSRSVESENATQTRLLFRAEPDLQAPRSPSPA